MLGIVGAGALGLTFAAALGASGADVTLLVRRGTSGQLLQERSVEISGALEARVTITTPPAPAGSIAVTEDPRDLAPLAGVLFAVKGHQLREVADAVSGASWGHGAGGGWVAGLQNGVVKDDVLAAAFGADRVLGAATVLSARRSSRRSVHVAGIGSTYLGEFGTPGAPGTSAAAPVSERARALCDALQRGSITCGVVPDIRSLLWTKLANAAGSFGVSALTRLTGPVMMSRPPLVAAYRALLEETAAVASAEGVEIGDYPELPMRSRLAQPAEEMVASIVSLVRARFPGDADAGTSMTSMAQDVVAGRRTEIEEVFGDLVGRAHAHCVAVPRLELVYQLIAGIDAR